MADQYRALIDALTAHDEDLRARSRAAGEAQLLGGISWSEMAQGAWRGIVNALAGDRSGQTVMDLANVPMAGMLVGGAPSSALGANALRRSPHAPDVWRKAHPSSDDIYPLPPRAYHGMRGELEGGQFDIKRAGQNYGYGDTTPGVFFTTSPSKAYEFALDAGGGIGGAVTGTSTVPANVTFKNPYRVDARASDLDPSEFWWGGRRKFFDEARQGGHDGVIVQGVDHSTLVALEPGTVRSPYSGETLFSNGVAHGSIPGTLLGYRNSLTGEDER